MRVDIKYVSVEELPEYKLDTEDLLGFHQDLDKAYLYHKDSTATVLHMENEGVDVKSDICFDTSKLSSSDRLKVIMIKLDNEKYRTEKYTLTLENP